MATHSRSNSSCAAVALDRLEAPTRPVVLVGFMAAGKTTIGRLLAQRLGRSFIDTDHEIEAAFAMPIAEIFRLNGEALFRHAERNMILRLLEGQDQVIALGGGAFVDDSVRAIINKCATTVWLDAPFELIFSRLGGSNGRPLASGKSQSDLLHLWRERQKFYAQAHFHIRTSDAGPETAAEEILAQLAPHR